MAQGQAQLEIIDYGGLFLCFPFLSLVGLFLQCFEPQGESLKQSL